MISIPVQPHIDEAGYHDNIVTFTNVMCNEEVNSPFSSVVFNNCTIVRGS